MKKTINLSLIFFVAAACLFSAVTFETSSTDFTSPSGLHDKQVNFDY